MRSGGSSLDLLRPRSPWSARPTAPGRTSSDTNGSSEYDVSSFSATLFQTDLEALGASERRGRHVVVRQRQQPLCALSSRTSVWNACAQPIGRRIAGDHVAATTKREIVASVIRLTTAFISWRPSSVAACWPIEPAAASPASSWPTAVAMFFGTGSSLIRLLLRHRVDDAAAASACSAAVLTLMPLPLAGAALEATPSRLAELLRCRRRCSSSSRIPASSRSKRAALKAAGDHAVSRRPDRRRNAPAAPRRSRSRAARRGGRPSSSTRGRCRPRCALIPGMRPSRSRKLRQASTSPPGWIVSSPMRWAVQQRRQFAERGVRSSGRPLVEQKAVGQNPDFQRIGERGCARDAGDASERRGYRGLGGRVEQDRACRCLCTPGRESVNRAPLLWRPAERGRWSARPSEILQRIDLGRIRIDRFPPRRARVHRANRAPTC